MMPADVLIVGGTLSAALALGWWVHRHQRDIDGYEEREYREPPIFLPPGGGPDGGL
jgi:hypothetical protein